MIAAEAQEHQHNVEYDNYINRINDRIGKNGAPIFMTDVDPDALYDAYLGAFADPAERQYHTCSCCRHFIKHYGALVTVDEDGRTVPLMWHSDEAPTRYKPAVLTMAHMARAGRITAPFFSADKVWGQPESGGWHHFAALNRNVFAERGRTPYQAMAEKKEDFKNLMVALDEFKPAHVDQIVTLVRAEAFDGSEMVLGQAVFLQQLHAVGKRAGIGHNKMWNLIATAPAGFCHPRASLIGTLLEDLSASKSFDQVASAFKAKIHPLKYQRPQAAPTAGAIAAAEKQFEAMGLAPALRRRFATIDDVQVKLWQPKRAAPAPASGIFGHLKPKGSESYSQLSVPPQAITFDKFRRQILPLADKIEYLVPRSSANYSALTAAADASAPSIIQWDDETARNTVAWYLYHGGSSAAQWSLTPGTYAEISAVTLMPHKWASEDAFSHQPAGAFFLIDGAVDTRTGMGNALFPSTLKADLHGMRPVIEAYSRSAEMEGREQASACGVLFQGNSPVDIRVTTGGQALHYRIDRFD